MPNLKVNGASIHYSEHGNGVPVVLLHGYPLDHRVWHHQSRELAGISRVIAPDLPGFGHSTPRGAFTMESLADDVFGLLTSIRALPCVLGGLSMGGYVALAYQAKYANTLRGLVLVDTRAEADSAEGKAGREKQIELVDREGAAAIAEAMLPKLLSEETFTKQPELVKELREVIASCPPQTIKWALAAMRDRPDLRGTLAKVAAPTLIIVGQEDVITPLAASQAMQLAIRGSRLEVIPGAGHMAVTEKPHEVSVAITKFLREVNK
jgi:3-oxoadipate enol-lactonase